MGALLVRSGAASASQHDVRTAALAIHSNATAPERRSGRGDVALSERLRAEFIAGSEADWHKRTGRSMTAEEPERMLRRYPGGRMTISDGSRITARTILEWLAAAALVVVYLLVSNSGRNPMRSR
jgi:hypothetical protein